jgi:4-amino-4-deoxy-L-arabinose transferase-like glycosyltransferase
LRNGVYVRGWLEISVVAGALLAVFGVGIDRVPFFPDESQWIATSYYFEAFLDRSAEPNVWSERYWTLTQPPLCRYVIALGRLAGGYRVGDLNPPWVLGIDDATNIAKGALPNPRLLWWSRLPMALLAVVSILILFRLVTAAAGRWAAYALVLLLVANPFVYRMLCRAMSEAPLLACTALFALASDAALAEWQRSVEGPYRSFAAFRRVAAWFFLAGCTCGLTAAAKLNGFATVPAGLILCALAAATHASKVPMGARSVLTAATAGLLLLGTALIFVVLNPYLYVDPLGRTVTLFNHRLFEVQRQLAWYPNYVIHGMTNRVEIVSRQIFHDCATMSFPGSALLNVVLCALGAQFLVRQAWPWLRGNPTGRTSVVILVVGLGTAAPALFTPLDWDRYYLLPVIAATVCIAVGIVTVITRLSLLWQSRTAA